MNRQMTRAVKRIETMPVASLMLDIPELGEVEFRFNMLALLHVLEERSDAFASLEEMDDIGGHGNISSKHVEMIGDILYAGCRNNRPDITREQLLENLPPDPELLAEIVQFFTGNMPNSAEENPTKARSRKRKSTGTGFFSLLRKN